jgi:AAA family ATP:ADP antiporter
MVCYYLLKTLREPLLLVNASAELKSYALAATAVVLLILVPMYGAVFRRTTRCQLIRWVTAFFVTNLAVFYLLSRAGLGIGFAYYVWVGVFSVSILAQFWALAADSYDTGSGQRVFPMIMAGATLGALAGPPLARVLFPAFGPSGLMLIAMIFLAATLPFPSWARDAVPDALRNREPAAQVSRSRVLGGFNLVVRDRYLMLLALMVVLLNCVNSLGEYILTEIVIRHAEVQVATQTGTDKGAIIAAFYSDFFFMVNALTLATQVLLVGRLFRWIGVQGAVLLLPLIALVGYGLAAFVPIFSVIRGIKILENSTDYSVMNTARQALYLPLPAAEKYEGKTTVDTFFWRCGDLLQAGLIYLGLHWFGFQFQHFAMLNIFLALVWLAVAVQIGREYARRAHGRTPVFDAGRTLSKVAALAHVAANYRLPLRTAVMTCLLGGVVLALPAASKADQDGLFTADEPLRMDFVMDMRALCRNPERKQCEDVPATLVYWTDTGEERRVEARVRVRGRWRRANGKCSLPALFLYFSATSTAGTVFEGQDMLPLTTHCQNGKRRYDQLVLKEYLAYRLYNLFTDKSLRVRLAHITYRDASGRKKPMERYGFFTEHFDSLAQRQAAEVWKPERFDPLLANPMELATMDLFQYMIGNTDWSALAGHNVMHIRDAEGIATAVPFDFDFSGLVDAPYAGPNPKLPLRNVKERLYRGFCNPGTDWAALFTEFQRRQGQISGLIEEVPDLTKREIRVMTRYVERFFEVVASGKQRQRNIVEACRPVSLD